MCRVRGQFLHLEFPSELTKITITDFHYREGSVSAFGSFVRLSLTVISAYQVVAWYTFSRSWLSCKHHHTLGLTRKESSPKSCIISFLFGRLVGVQQSH